jgi:hypothetical protein
VVAFSLTYPADSLIAIMLGRLEMDVDECINAFSRFTKAIFAHKNNRLPFSSTLKTQPRFDSATLEKAIQETIAGRNISQRALFNDDKERRCKT